MAEFINFFVLIAASVALGYTMGFGAGQRRERAVQKQREGEELERMLSEQSRL